MPLLSALNTINRTNSAPNPAAVSGANDGWTTFRWHGNGGVTGTYSYATGVAGPLTGLTTSRRKTWTSACTINNGDTGFEVRYTTAQYFPVTPGEIITVSAYMRHTSAGQKNLNLRCFFKNSATVTGSTDVSNVGGPQTMTDANTWFRTVNANVTVPAGAFGLVIYVDVGLGGTLWQPGETLDATGLLIERAAATGAYFDGSTASAGGVDYRWNGAANNSTSVGSNGQIAGWVANQPRTNRAPNPNAVGTSGNDGWSVGRWFGGGSATGAYSYLTGISDHPAGITTARRKTWTVAAPSNGATGFEIYATYSPRSCIPSVAGETVTLSGWLRPSRGTMTCRAAIFAYDRLDNTSGGLITSQSGSNVSVDANTWGRVSVTWTLPANTIGIQVVIDVSAGPLWQPGDTLDGTGLLIETSRSQNDYFTGDTADTSYDRYDWTGTPNNSTSTMVGIAQHNLRQAYQGTALVTPANRTNRYPNPRAVDPASGGGAGWVNNRWFGSAPGAGAYSYLTGIAGHPAGITTARRKTWSAAPPTAGDTGFELRLDPSNWFPVTPGETLTVSGWLRPSKDVATAQAQIDIFDDVPAGAPDNLIITARGTVGTAPANVWTRFSVTYTLPALSAGMRIILDTDALPSSGTWQPGDTLDGTGLMVEASGTLNTYRDGGAGNGWWWDGTPNNAQSNGWVS